MYIAGRWADRQLSRLELVTAVIILSLVLFVFLHYMLKMFAIAERSMLSTTITNINTAMQSRAAAYVMRGDYTSLEAMPGMNPFNYVGGDSDLVAEVETGVPLKLLETLVYLRVPANYLGELDKPDPADIEGREWYFDLGNRTLVYRIDNAEYFDSSLPGPPRVEFLVKVDYEDRNADNRFEVRIDEYLGVRLVAVSEYEWQL